MKHLSWDEIVSLFKQFFQYQLACFLVFGGWIVVPVQLWSWRYGDDTVDSTTSSPAGWGSRVIAMGIVLAFLILIINNWRETLEWFETFFASLKKITEGWGKIKITMLLFFMYYSIYLWRTSPFMAWYVSVLGFMPACMTYNSYTALKISKIDKNETLL